MEIGQGAVLQTEVDIHNAQRVQQLALVLVQALDLNIEDEVGIQLDALLLGDDLAQLLLLLALDIVELANHIVIDHGLELGNAVQILQEVTAHPVADHLSQLGVAQTQPAAGCHAIGLVLEALGKCVVPVLEAVVLQNLRVDLRDAVDVAAHINGQICHMRGVVTDDEQIRMLTFQLGINALDDLHNFGHHGAQQIQRPLLQRLAHNGVVGIGEGFLGDGERVIEVHALCHQQPDQLGDGHGRMGIIELHRVEVRKVGQIGAVRPLVSAQHILQ